MGVKLLGRSLVHLFHASPEEEEEEEEELYISIAPRGREGKTYTAKAPNSSV